MNSRSITLTLFAIVGAILGMLAAWYVLYRLRGADLSIIREYFYSYLFLGGYNYKKVIFLLGSTIGGASLFTLIAIVMFTRSNASRLREAYSEFNFDTKYIVAQRSRETWFVGLFFIGVAMGVLYLFLLIHNPDAGANTVSIGSIGTSTTQVASAPIYSFLKLSLTAFVSITCVIVGLIAIYAALNYGRFKRLPIEVADESVSFFQTFSRFPILAIDRPVTVDLADAEIDFDATSKGSLMIANDGLRLAVSPKLDFINGSFDELADYVEKFAVEDDD